MERHGLTAGTGSAVGTVRGQYVLASGQAHGVMWTGKMPTVLNKRLHTIPKDAVYIGRPSKWGNPFVIGLDGSRDEVVRKHKAYLMAMPKLCEDAKKELRGKDLVCWCKPGSCHGDILLEIANGD
jgi:hypothetical protein